MNIALCMIVRDDSELESLKKAVASAEPFVTSVHITSNGKNVSKIKKYCKQAGFDYSHLAWSDDFSAQRNFNFSRVPKDTDYIFWMDCDDLLVGGEHLQSVATDAKKNGKDIVFFTYWYGCSFDGQPSLETFRDVEMEHMRERLLRPGVTTWKKRLHETPVPVNGVQENYTAFPYNKEVKPIAIMHTSEDKDLGAKMERNKRILELELEEELSEGKPDPRTQLYLMKIYAEQDDPTNWEKCLVLNESYQAQSGWDEERGTAWEQAGIVYGKMNDFRKACQAFHNAIGPDNWPHQPLFYIRYATALFNLGKYKACKHWLDVASQMGLDNKGTNITNFKAMKVMFAQLLLKLNYNVFKDTNKALEAAKLLYVENPTEENREQVLFLEDVCDLNNACKNVDELAKYLHQIDEDKALESILNALPQAISAQPFAIRLRNEVSEPRVWADNEICYFANFGSKHFEQWGPESLESGIGGSETAVIELSKQWAKLGYRVTVYGDPQHERGTHDGVTFLPWYEFNKNDEFNIFIQWRMNSLAGKVKAKKFFVDLHDVFTGLDYSEEVLKHIDKVMVKSQYHRSLAPQIPDDKISIISNGI